MPSNQFWLFKPIKINKYIESFLIPFWMLFLVS